MLSEGYVDQYRRWTPFGCAMHTYTPQAKEFCVNESSKRVYFIGERERLLPIFEFFINQLPSKYIEGAKINLSTGKEESTITGLLVSQVLLCFFPQNEFSQKTIALFEKWSKLTSNNINADYQAETDCMSQIPTHVFLSVSPHRMHKDVLLHVFKIQFKANSSAEHERHVISVKYQSLMEQLVALHMGLNHTETFWMEQGVHYQHRSASLPDELVGAYNLNAEETLKTVNNIRIVRVIGSVIEQYEDNHDDSVDPAPNISQKVYFSELSCSHMAFAYRLLPELLSINHSEKEYVSWKHAPQN
ncbi:unnamed protein product [Dicrocoelium dendriticum]|nr:unnamed protein product [Dicrocoelium dendriticum]